MAALHYARRQTCRTPLLSALIIIVCCVSSTMWGVAGQSSFQCGLTCPAPGNATGCSDNGNGKYTFSCPAGYYISGGAALCVSGVWVTPPQQCILPSFGGCHSVAANQVGSAWVARCPANEIVVGGSGVCAAGSSIYRYGPTEDMQGWLISCSGTVTAPAALCCAAAVDTFRDLNAPIDTAMASVQGGTESSFISVPITAATESSSVPNYQSTSSVSLSPTGSFFRNCEYISTLSGFGSSTASLTTSGMVLAVGGSCYSAIQSMTGIGAGYFSITCASSSNANFAQVHAVVCDPILSAGSQPSCGASGCSSVAFGISYTGSSSSLFTGYAASLSVGSATQLTYSSSLSLHAGTTIPTGYVISNTPGCSYSQLPTLPLFSSWTSSQQTFTLGESVSLVCEPGFFLVGGHSNVVCGPNGFSPSTVGACSKLDQSGCYTAMFPFAETKNSAGVMTCPALNDGQQWLAVQGNGICMNNDPSNHGYANYITSFYPINTTTWSVGCSLGGGDGNQGLYPPAVGWLTCCPAVAPIMNTCQVVKDSACNSTQWAVGNGIDCSDGKEGYIALTSAGVGANGFPKGVSGGSCYSGNMDYYNMCCNRPSVADNTQICRQVAAVGNSYENLHCAQNEFLYNPITTWYDPHATHTTNSMSQRRRLVTC